jgi:Dolichyl-phosphate-mannose-protein mannosyltransferase
MHVDEAHYMRRAMLVLHGLGPQEPVSGGYPYPFDHPYFGQLFLAGALKLIDYPDSLNPSSGSGLEDSIQALYLVPRVVMGLLAVLDTFLIYKISQLRYNRNTALFASVLFAVMPLTWMLRRIYLDTILTPFLLSSILFVLYCSTTRFNNDTKKTILLTSLSGIFLGMAIFTKIPAIAIIPLVAFLVYKNSNMKVLGIWFIPVILIPLIWVAYSVSIGHFDLWLKDSIFQAHRTKTVFGSMMAIFQIDPVLLTLSTAGVILAAIKRDLFILLWIGSFLIFFLLIGWVQYFHWIPVLPIFCIAAARLIEFLSDKIGKTQVREWWAIKSILNKNKLQMLLPYTIIFGIGIFGFVSTTLLISTNVNSSFFEIYAAVLQHMPSSYNSRIIDNSTTVDMVGSHWWLWNVVWIPEYVFHKNIALIDPHFDPFFKKSIESKRFLFIADQSFIHQTLRRNPFILTPNNGGFHIERLETLYRNIAAIRSIVDNLGPYDSTKFPYTSIPIMILLENRGLGPVEIRAN